MRRLLLFRLKDSTDGCTLTMWKERTDPLQGLAGNLWWMRLVGLVTILQGSASALTFAETMSHDRLTSPPTVVSATVQIALTGPQQECVSAFSLRDAAAASIGVKAPQQKAIRATPGGTRVHHVEPIVLDRPVASSSRLSLNPKGGKKWCFRFFL